MEGKRRWKGREEERGMKKEKQRKRGEGMSKGGERIIQGRNRAGGVQGITQ